MSEVEYRILDNIDLPGYRAGSDGSAWSRMIRKLNSGGVTGWTMGDNWKKLKPCKTNSYGHMQFSFYHEGKQKIILAHRLVLETFVGPCPPGMECRHLDGNPANNRLENLCWGTMKENSADQARHGTKVEGEKVGTSVLTSEQVLKIRKLYENKKFNQRELGSMFGVSQANISAIIRRKWWKSLEAPRTGEFNV